MGMWTMNKIFVESSKDCIKFKKNQNPERLSRKKIWHSANVVGWHARRTRAAIPEISHIYDHGQDVEEQGDDENVGI